MKDLLLRVVGWPNWMRRLQGPSMLTLLDLKPTDLVLDLGCGSGPFTYESSKRGCSTVGLDVVPIQNAQIVMNLDRRVSYVVADGMRLPFRKGSFSKAILSSVTQMVPEPQLLLNEVRRLLRDDGHYVLSVPTQHVIIPRLYDCVGSGLLRLGLPAKYESFAGELAKAFGASGKGIIREDELERMVSGSGAHIETRVWIPGKISSCVYEILLMVAWRLDLPLSSFLYSPLLYPIGWLEMLLSSGKGNELIIVGAPSSQRG